MSESPHSDWFRDFFNGAALDVWRAAIPPEATEEELSFLEEALACKEGAHVLDLPCGNGRLTLPMTANGYRMTGVDFSNEFIKEAKAAASKAKVKIEYLQGDVREIGIQSTFDGAFCMGNSFGYFDASGTLKFFEAVNASLKPSAKFILDSLMLAETFLVNGAEREWIEVGDMYMLVENEYNCRLSCVETNYTFIKQGQQEKRRAAHWIYTVGELCRMLEQSGFTINDIYGSLDFEPYSLGSERLLLVAEKRS